MWPVRVASSSGPPRLSEMSSFKFSKGLIAELYMRKRGLQNHEDGGDGEVCTSSQSPAAARYPQRARAALGPRFCGHLSGRWDSRASAPPGESRFGTTQSNWRRDGVAKKFCVGQEKMDVPGEVAPSSCPSQWKQGYT